MTTYEIVEAGSEPILFVDIVPLGKRAARVVAGLPPAPERPLSAICRVAANGGRREEGAFAVAQIEPPALVIACADLREELDGWAPPKSTACVGVFVMPTRDPELARAQKNLAEFRRVCTATLLLAASPSVSPEKVLATALHDLTAFTRATVIAPDLTSVIHALTTGGSQLRCASAQRNGPDAVQSVVRYLIPSLRSRAHQMPRRVLLSVESTGPVPLREVSLALEKLIEILPSDADLVFSVAAGSSTSGLVRASMTAGVPRPS